MALFTCFVVVLYTACEIKSGLAVAINFPSAPAAHISRRLVIETEAERNTSRENMNKSIKYWDIDDRLDVTELRKTEIKNEVLNELQNNPFSIETGDRCYCSKVAFPLVCDNNGKLHANICLFHCGSANEKGKDLQPTMIVMDTETEFSKSKKICNKRFGKINDIIIPIPYTAKVNID